MILLSETVSYLVRNLVRKENQSPLGLAAADVQGHPGSCSYLSLCSAPTVSLQELLGGKACTALLFVAFSACSFNSLHLSPWRRNYFQSLPALKTFILNSFILIVFSNSVKYLLKGEVLRSLVFAQKSPSSLGTYYYLLFIEKVSTVCRNIWKLRRF